MHRTIADDLEQMQLKTYPLRKRRARAEQSRLAMAVLGR